MKQNEKRKRTGNFIFKDRLKRDLTAKLEA
jgi:hypothetical protein